MFISNQVQLTRQRKIWAVQQVIVHRIRHYVEEHEEE